MLGHSSSTRRWSRHHYHGKSYWRCSCLWACSLASQLGKNWFWSTSRGRHSRARHRMRDSSHRRKLFFLPWNKRQECYRIDSPFRIPMGRHCCWRVLHHWKTWRNRWDSKYRNSYQPTSLRNRRSKIFRTWCNSPIWYCNCWQSRRKSRTNYRRQRRTPSKHT